MGGGHFVTCHSKLKYFPKFAIGRERSLEVWKSSQGLPYFYFDCFLWVLSKKVMDDGELKVKRAFMTLDLASVKPHFQI